MCFQILLMFTCCFCRAQVMSLTLKIYVHIYSKLLCNTTFSLKKEILTRCMTLKNVHKQNCDGIMHLLRNSVRSVILRNVKSDKHCDKRGSALFIICFLILP